MLFNSFVFIFAFAPITFALWALLRRYGFARAAVAALLAASFFFYAWWNPPYLLLLVASIAINYALHRAILYFRKADAQRLAKAAAVIGVVFDIVFIGYFKYKNFFLSNIDALLGRQGVYTELFLPLGISFFTFQQIACLVDTYKGKIEKINPIDYALFVAFFPQLIAGPIVKCEDLVPKIRSASKERKIKADAVCLGLCVFACGLFKKIVIADHFAPIAAQLFDGTVAPTFYDAAFGTLAYTLQLYFDFSGYSDMALGLGLLFGIPLPQNFDSPYQSCSIIDFWRRWHMTLSSFLKEYVYIPLGGNRRGGGRRYLNLFLTMLIGGLWHGAGWNFVLWGGLHGAYLIANHSFRAITKERVRVPKLIGWALTFAAVAFAWIFFRAPSMTRAFEVIKAFNPAGIPNLDFVALEGALGASYAEIYTNIALLFACLAIAALAPNVYKIFNKIKATKYKAAFAFGILFDVSLWFMLSADKVQEFLYFQF